MAEASCRRELELEIPAEEVSKASERVAKEISRVAKVPGFRTGKAPLSLIKRRFADDIKGEVLQSLVPERVEKAVVEEKLSPVSQPQVEKLEFNEGQPLKFRAVFEVLPEFELGKYKGLDIEMPAMEVTDPAGPCATCLPSWAMARRGSSCSTSTPPTWGSCMTRQPAV